MDNFWEKLGLKENPYDFKPLGIDEMSRKLFVGRSNELSKLDSLISGNKGGLIIVEGEVGVGKTSFVNNFQYGKWQKEKILPSFRKIELSANTDPVNFMLSVFSNMLFSLEEVLDSKVLKKFSEHSTAKSYVAKTIDSGLGANINLFGFGGGVSKQKTVSQPPSVMLPTILVALDEWIKFVIEKTKFKGIIIPIDNFDIVDEKTILSFLNTMRDTLIDRQHIWWIIVGQKGLSSLIENNAHRVSEVITGKPVVLESMSLKEINDMIDLRYKFLKKSKEVEKIIPDEIIKILYLVSKGEARYILKRITDMIYAFMTEFPTEKKISLNVAKKMLYDDAKTRIENADLTSRKTVILQKMSSLGAFQSKDYKKLKLNNAPAVIDYVEQFRAKGFITKIETTGKSVYYRTRGDVNIYFNENLLKS